jgi:hypothetical protein
MSRDIEPRNDKGEQHGYCEVYYYSGDLMLKGFCQNNKPLGYEEYYENYIGELTRKIYNL